MGLYYTVQTREAYKSLKEQGFLAGDVKYIDKEMELLDGYNWLLKQMEKRGYENDTYPVWLWGNKKDAIELIENYRDRDKDSDDVLLTLEIPDEKVLVMDFYAWEFVIFDWDIHLNEDESEESMKKDEILSEEEQRLAKEATWERIFDFELLKNAEYWKDDERIVQGVINRITLDQIIETEYK